MNKKEIAQKVIENNGGIAKTADFTEKGMKNYDVAVLCKEGYIKRVRRGFYQLPHSNQLAEEQLIRELLPQGIVCVESALFHYGYSDFAPREWSVAVPRTASRVIKKMDKIAIKAYYIQKDYIKIGKCEDNFNGIILRVAKQFPDLLCLIGIYDKFSVGVVIADGDVASAVVQSGFRPCHAPHPCTLLYLLTLRRIRQGGRSWLSRTIRRYQSSPAWKRSPRRLDGILLQ